MPSIRISKRILWILSAIVILLLCLFLLRSCFSHTTTHPVKKFYIIGRDSSWYPLSLAGKERNLQAFTNELLTAISKDTGLRFQWAESGPGQLLPFLDSGEFDAIMSSMSPTIVNQEHYLFSEPFYEVGPVLVVRENSPINSFEQSKELTIGITSDSSIVFNSVRTAGANVFNHTFIYYNTMNKALEALLANKIDGVILGALPAYMQAQGYLAGSIKIVTNPLSNEGERMISLKSANFSEFLIESFNNGLEKLREDGTYDALIKKWDLINTKKIIQDK